MSAADCCVIYNNNQWNYDASCIMAKRAVYKFIFSILESRHITKKDCQRWFNIGKTLTVFTPNKSENIHIGGFAKPQNTHVAKTKKMNNGVLLNEPGTYDSTFISFMIYELIPTSCGDIYGIIINEATHNNDLFTEYSLIVTKTKTAVKLGDKYILADELQQKLYAAINHDLYGNSL
jgi:hypothetical protein